MIIKRHIPFSYIIKELRGSLIYISLIAIVSGILPIFFHSFLSDIPISIATTLGVAISILLSYKINQSYERWWEARKIWGEIVNDSRTFVMQLQTYLNKENQLIETMSKRQIAWNYCLGRFLRKKDSEDILGKWLSTEDVELISKHNNIPLSILSLQMGSIGQLYQTDKLDKFSQIQLEETIARLTSSMGKCERIKNTVFPPIYRMGLHITIYLFTIFLSLSVAFGLQHFLLEFFILVIVSTVFFFLEKAAHRLQDPFENLPTDTPMTSIAEMIEVDILNLLGKETTKFSTESEKIFFKL